jgi:hypothetical protein
MHPRRAAALLALSVALAACTASTTPVPSSAPASSPRSTGNCPAAPDAGQPAGWQRPTTKLDVVPVLINSPGELTCGPNRLLFSFLDSANRPIGEPNRTGSIALFDLARDATKPASTMEGTFVWAIEDSVGIYVANVTFPEAGLWGAEFSTSVAGGTTHTMRMTFTVQRSSTMVRVGDRAPASKTPTGDPAKISTDSKPDDRLYKVSVDKAIADHKPFVLVFATPKFCTSGQCGPTLDRIKPFIDKYFPGVLFINVEPYVLKDEGGQLQPVLTKNNLTPAQPTLDWGLLSEPWIFVVDRDGIVRGSFGLIFGEAELTAAIDQVK